MDSTDSSLSSAEDESGGDVVVADGSDTSAPSKSSPAEGNKPLALEHSASIKGESDTEQHLAPRSSRKRMRTHRFTDDDNDEVIVAGSYVPQEQTAPRKESKKSKRETGNLETALLDDNICSPRPRRRAATRVTSYALEPMHLPGDMEVSASASSDYMESPTKRNKVAKASNVALARLDDARKSESNFASHLKKKLRKSDVKGPRKLTAKDSSDMRERSLTRKDFALKEIKLRLVNGQTYLLQSKACQTLPRFLEVDQCKHCTLRQAGDSCRFQGLRAWPVREEGDRMILLGHESPSEDAEYPSIFLSEEDCSEQLDLPNHFDLNRPMDDRSREEITYTAALSLVSIMEQGLLHAEKAGCIFRKRELEIRAMCDFCSTGLFSASYMCQRCGQEYCEDCRLAMDAESDTEQGVPYIKSCVPARSSHSSEKLVPVSRFSVKELRQESERMRQIVDQYAGDASIIMSSAMDKRNEEQQTDTIPVQAGDGSVPSHPIVTTEKAALDANTFLASWAKGEPLVVSNITTKNVWDPAAFIERYGTMKCDVVRSDQHAPFLSKEQRQAMLKTDSVYSNEWHKAVSVRQFFQTFGEPAEAKKKAFGKGIWKLKDWPPSSAFSTAFPEINEDFNYAVPMPDYTRRDGCKNLSSLFPKNANGPDLGPKMYNAWKGEHSKGALGTTCLHMDIADAVNILLDAVEGDTSEAPAAQWDIFRAEDANAIRQFLNKKHPEMSAYGDPIHSQLYFLDDEALKELFDEFGVHSWRILQERGQAVFIPAGCAHQVCNLADCIKVAVDFISPQNVQRCFQLTEEFRGMTFNGRKSWKEDVLQLKAQLWYAWKTCSNLPHPPELEEHRLENEKRTEIRRLANEKGKVKKNLAQKSVNYSERPIEALEEGEIASSASQILGPSAANDTTSSSVHASEAQQQNMNDVLGAVNSLSSHSKQLPGVAKKTGKRKAAETEAQIQSNAQSTVMPQLFQLLERMMHTMTETQRAMQQTVQIMAETSRAQIDVMQKLSETLQGQTRVMLQMSQERDGNNDTIPAPPLKTPLQEVCPMPAEETTSPMHSDTHKTAERIEDGMDKEAEAEAEYETQTPPGGPPQSPSPRAERTSSFSVPAVAEQA